MLLYIINLAQFIILIIQLTIHAVQFVVQSQKLLVTLCQRPFHPQRFFHLNINKHNQHD